MTEPGKANEIVRTLLDHLEGEISGASLSVEDGRIGCVTPLELPNRDNIVVWVSENEGSYYVTDHGEALGEFSSSRETDRRYIDDFAKQTSRLLGVEYANGRLEARGELAEVGELVWLVGTAAARLALAAEIGRKKRPKREEREFVGEVATDLRRHHFKLDRSHPIRGRSGHEHQVTLYLPETESVIEPVSDHWNRVSAAYTRLGDLNNSNGYHLYSLLDDRGGKPNEDVADLLQQVSNVIEWSRRDEWLEKLRS